MEARNTDLCNLAKNGDRDALNMLLAVNRKLVYRVAYTVRQAALPFCQSLCIDQDDLVQEGLIKLWHAIPEYSESRHTKFSTFCYTVVRNAMYDYLRTEKKHFVLREKYSVLSLEQITKQTHSEPYDQFRFKLPEQAYIEKETLEELQAAWEKITDRDRAYLAYRFGLEETPEHLQKEAAAYFHLSRGRCRKTEKTALEHLREGFPKMKDSTAGLGRGSIPFTPSGAQVQQEEFAAANSSCLTLTPTPA